MHRNQTGMSARMRRFLLDEAGTSFDNFFFFHFHFHFLGACFRCIFFLRPPLSYNSVLVVFVRSYRAGFTHTSHHTRFQQNAFDDASCIYTYPCLSFLSNFLFTSATNNCILPNYEFQYTCPIGQGHDCHDCHESIQVVVWFPYYAKSNIIRNKMGIIQTRMECVIYKRTENSWDVGVKQRSLLLKNIKPWIIRRNCIKIRHQE